MANPNVDSIFHAALAKPDPEERSSYLDEACRGDDQLRRRVERLLQADPEVGSFLEAPAPELAATSESSFDERPGAEIGPYKLLEQIGEGGFGVVYLAEQVEPVRRTVALKIVKPGMDSKQVIARFEAERQALALMDHPNIARILDAGSTDSGRPYFVMELVKGIPITEYCDQCNSTTEERLNLFVSVCQAVQHAHQKGVIHRDIKPTNVLVTVPDGRPVAKMIDFGVAKAINQRLTEQTLRTGFAQMLGTPLYMSPEQAEMSPLDIDTRTDIYSLGVLLYELLTGMTPFDKERLSTATFDELRRIIRDEEPPRPSARLSTASPEQADTVAAHRRTDAHGLIQMLRGDLDWIVIMAMEKDRTRRYESASALARDIERYERNEPVQACPPSSWYRFCKFARRRKGALAAAVLLFALAIAGPLLALNQAALYSTAEGLRRQAQNDADQYRRLLYVADMNLALHDWDAGNVDRVLELLKRHIPNARDTDLRGFEWYHLWHLCQKAAAVPRVTTDNAVWSIDVSFDGKSMIIGHYGGVAMWDMAMRKKRFALPIEQTNVVHAVSFAPDGMSFATTGPSNTIQFWDAQTGAPGQQLVGHQGWVFSLAFSRDGTKLASASWDQSVKLWDVATGDCLATLEGHETEVFCVAFSPDGAFVASGGWDGIVRVWDVAKEEQIAELTGHEDMIVAVAFSPNGRRIASSSRDKSVRVWDAVDGKQRLVLRSARSWMGSVAFSPDGRTIAGGDGANAIYLWDAEVGELIDTLKGHGSSVTAVRFHTQDSVLISASWDHTVRFWDLSSARVPAVLIPKPKPDSPKGHRDLISIDVSSNQAIVAAGGVDGRVHIWEVDSGRQRAAWQAHDNWVTGVAFHPTKNLLASASWDGTIKLWNPADPDKPLVTLTAHKSKVQAVEFSPDGKVLGSASEDSTVRLWDVETWASAGVLKGHSGWINDIAFSPGKLASSDDDSTIRIWSLDTHRLLNTITVSGDSRWVTGIDFSSDGGTLSAADWQGTVSLWNVDDGRQQVRFRGHASSVEDAAFSPTESILATCGIDFSIKLWDVETGALRGTLIGHTDDVNALVFTANGRVLLSASDDGTIRVWRAAARE